MIIDEPYTINEKYGEKRYYISIDSPDYNQPVHIWDADCRVTNTKKIARLQTQARAIQAKGRSDTPEWKRLST